MKIESFFPGRIRVSSPLFKDDGKVAELRERLAAVDGVREFAVNPRTGSLTLSYDSGKISMHMLNEARNEIERMEKEG